MMYNKKGPGDPKKKKKKATRSMVSKLPKGAVDYDTNYISSLFKETGPKSRAASSRMKVYESLKKTKRKVSEPYEAAANKKKRVYESLKKTKGRKVSKPKN